MAKISQQLTLTEVEEQYDSSNSMKQSKKELSPHQKQIRAVAHVSQYALSMGTGIDRSRLSSIENGYISPRPGEVEQIERFVSAPQFQQMARLKRALLIG